jgi:hypothetical protein
VGYFGTLSHAGNPGSNPGGITSTYLFTVRPDVKSGCKGSTASGLPSGCRFALVKGNDQSGVAFKTIIQNRPYLIMS